MPGYPEVLTQAGGSTALPDGDRSSSGEAGDIYWTPGLSLRETIERYSRFYLVTSLGFDLFRAVGNVVLVLALGGPILRLLERYRRRFNWEPWQETDAR